MRCNISRAARDGLGRAGFSLIEVAVAIVIIGIGVLALLTCVGAGTRANDAGQELTQATFLAQEIREWTLGLPFSDPNSADQGNPPGLDSGETQYSVDDLDDLMDVTYSPPRDGTGSAISDMGDWSQTLTLTWRDPADLATVVAPGTSNVIHVELTLYHKGREALATGWLVTRREQS